MKPKLIAVVGPTASGKTSLGIKIAKEVGGEIISVDSRQIYKGMDIVTGKEPGEWDEERQVLITEGIEHWGIDIVRPDEDYSAAEFKEYTEQKIKEILGRGKVPVLVGGTGFWLQALIDNFDLTQTAADPELREELETKGLEELTEILRKLDPDSIESMDLKNKRKIVRAIEVSKVTGKPFSQQQRKGEVVYEVFQIGIAVEREVLAERISTRVDQMLAEGLIEEVKGLQAQYGCEAASMTGIGYQSFCKFLKGEMTQEEALEEMKKESRQYAKRQMTWFRRDDRINWITDREKGIGLATSFIAK